MKKVQAKTRAKPVSPNAADYAQSLQELFGNKDFVFQMLDKFPFPIEVFSADGTLVFINRAFQGLYNIKNNALIVGKYNLLCDPLCFAQPGHQELYRSAFKGEKISCFISSPIIDDFIPTGNKNEKIPEPDVIELCFHPIRDGKKLTFVVCVFITTNNKEKRKERNGKK
jgi:PAS domain-containing protein